MKKALEIVFLITIIVSATVISIGQAFDVAIINDQINLITTDQKYWLAGFLSLIAIYVFVQLTFYKSDLSFTDKLQYNLGLCFYILFIYLFIQEANSGV
jgi:hypothetical protein